MTAARKIWRHPELPWLVVGGLVFVLALNDRFPITGQSRFINRMLDWTMIISAMIGSCYSWVSSYRAPLRTTLAPGAILPIRIFVCWLLGPFLVVGTAFPARDIDGGLLLFYPPFLGLLLTTFVLPLLILRRRRRFGTPTAHAPSSPRKAA